MNTIHGSKICEATVERYIAHMEDAFIAVEKSMKPRRDEKGYVMMGVKEFCLIRIV